MVHFWGKQVYGTIYYTRHTCAGGLRPDIVSDLLRHVYAVCASAWMLCEYLFYLLPFLHLLLSFSFCLGY